jgi:hypothetical protein
VARFHVAEAFDLLNFVIVWVMAATFGLVVRDWRDSRVGLLAVVSAAIAANVLLIRFGPYPLSMVGLPSDRISNMAPPTLVLGLHAVVLIGLVGVMWRALERVCARPRLWHGVCALGGVAMTAYLWHLTALIVVTVTEHGLGLDRIAPYHPNFWPTTIAHLAVVLFVVVLLVSIAAPLEHLAVPWLERARSPVTERSWRTAAEVAGAAVCGVAFLVLAGTGMQGFPFGRVTRYAGLRFTPGLAIAMLVAGTLLARAGGRSVVPRAAPPDAG